MAEIKHTPSPWRAELGTEDERDRWLILAAYGDQPWLVATVENGAPGDTLETEMHTAHLVAEAPAMYAFLRKIVGQLDPKSLFAYGWCAREAGAILDRLHGEQPRERKDGE